MFDEGHHVFDAADGAFSSHLTGMEAAEMRRWVCGPEGGRRRGRGLSDRVGDLIGDDEQAGKLLESAIRAARELPGPGWLQRLGRARPRTPPNGSSAWSASRSMPAPKDSPADFRWRPNAHHRSRA